MQKGLEVFMCVVSILDNPGEALNPKPGLGNLDLQV